MDAILNGPSGRTALGPTVLTIGRAPTNALVVNDAKASSRHAEISPAGAGYSITDVGSTNGTFVNEQRLDRNVPRMLAAGDKVRIGDTVFTYEGPGAIQQDATVYAGEANNPGYQPTVAAPPPYTNYDQGYVPPQQQQPWASYQQFPQQSPSPYSPPPAEYPPYAPGQPGYAGAPAATTAPKMKRNLLIALGAGVVAVVVLLIVLFVVVLPSTPNKTLDAFCSSIQNGDYQAAYNQFSPALQNMQSESQFASENKSTSCTHSSTNQSGRTATANLTTVSSSGTTSTGQVSLIQDSNNNWKIDALPSTPSTTLDAFCNALKVSDYQTAYNQLSTRVQAQGSEASFASAFSQAQINSCTYNTLTVSGNTASGNITFFTASSPGTPVNGTVSLINENGTWKIDNLNIPTGQ